MATADSSAPPAHTTIHPGTRAGDPFVAAALATEITTIEMEIAMIEIPISTIGATAAMRAGYTSASSSLTRTEST